MWSVRYVRRSWLSDRMNLCNTIITVPVCLTIALNAFVCLKKFSTQACDWLCMI
jgi:hypothetical protein